jgi:hypothetical protein
MKQSASAGPGRGIRFGHGNNLTPLVIRLLSKIRGNFGTDAA